MCSLTMPNTVDSQGGENTVKGSSMVIRCDEDFRNDFEVITECVATETTYVQCLRNKEVFAVRRINNTVLRALPRVQHNNVVGVTRLYDFLGKFHIIYEHLDILVLDLAPLRNETEAASAFSQV